MYLPNPFFPHPDGPWHETHFDEVVYGIKSVLEKYANNELSRDQICKGKDNGYDRVWKTNKEEKINYWLYYQHHKGSERWKCLGQRYWSVQAYRSFRKKYFSFPENKRLNSRDKGPHQNTLPKRKAEQLEGLVSEHVIPKRVMQDLLLKNKWPIEELLTLNLCAVITLREDRKINELKLRSSHPNPFKPLHRYKGTGIQFIPNPDWSFEEKTALEEYNLVFDGVL